MKKKLSEHGLFPELGEHNLWFTAIILEIVALMCVIGYKVLTQQGG